MKKVSITVLAVLFAIVLGSIASADVAQIKAYKEAYPDAKPKCIDCHTVAIPKKDGDHGLNEYGNKVKALAEKPTVEEYKKAGSIESNKK